VEVVPGQPFPSLVRETDQSREWVKGGTVDVVHSGHGEHLLSRDEPMLSYGQEKYELLGQDRVGIGEMCGQGTTLVRVLQI
jgi:hypothetical protein